MNILVFDSQHVNAHREAHLEAAQARLIRRSRASQQGRQVSGLGYVAQTLSRVGQTLDQGGRVFRNYQKPRPDAAQS